jgi:hypothetical protein
MVDVKDHVTVMNGFHRFATRFSLCASAACVVLVTAAPTPVRAEESAAPPTIQATMMRRAEGHLRHGLQLAERRAVFAAHDQFIESLKLVAYTLDAESGLATHSQALAAGLSALEEADSFLASRTEILTPTELSAIMAGHRTKLDTGAESAPNTTLTPLQGVERYLAVAGEQLKRASGGAPVASYALYGLGRVYALRSAQQSPRAVVFEHKAMALYRTAVAVDANNYLAGNELGVLLYRNGLREEALWTLLRSVSVSPEPETAQNLIVVYQALGDADGAAWAEVLHQTLVAQDNHSAVANIGGGSALSLKWVDADTFSNVANTGDFVEPHQPVSAAVPIPEHNALPGSTAKAEPEKLWPLAQPD